MKVYLLQPVGDSIASNPNQGTSNSYRVLSYLRRHGNQASSEQLADHLMIGKSELNRIMTELERNQAVKCIVSA